MKKVIVVTDSTATIPKALLRELDIRIVPVMLHLAGRSYRDGIDMTPSEFYRRLRSNKHLPTTSAPSVGDFVRVFAAAGLEASAIVSVHLSPKLSATFEAAALASQLVDGPPIRVVDARSATMAQGFVVLEAARTAAAGGTLDAVVARAEEVAARVRLYATLDTLEYVHRGGRIGGAAALLGSLLQIKPVVYLANGRVEPLARPRTRRRAIDCILRNIAREVDRRPIHAAVLQADAEAEAQELKHRLAEQFQCVELYVTEFTPVMGAHSGPGVLGVAFYAD